MIHAKAKLETPSLIFGVYSSYNTNKSYKQRRMSKSEALNPPRGNQVEELLITQGRENVISLSFKKMGVSSANSYEYP